jgi:hypothetical protein
MAKPRNAYSSSPGGTVTQLAEGGGTYSFMPANGAHFYYALVSSESAR